MLKEQPQTSKKLDGLIFAYPFQNSRKIGQGNTLLEFSGYKDTIGRIGKIIGTDEVDDWQKQTALYAFCMGVTTLLLERMEGAFPDIRVGHSIGENFALVTDVTSEEDMAKILHQREAILDASITGNAMFAVGRVPIEEVEKKVNQAREQGLFVGLANKNTPDQSVLSGALPDLLDLEKFFKESFEGTRRIVYTKIEGIRNAYHSFLMTKERDALVSRIEEFTHRFRDPEGRIYSPMLGTWIETSQQAIEMVRNQFITGVDYVKAWAEITKASDPKIIIAIDPSGKLKKVIEANFSNPVNILTVNDPLSYRHALSTIGKTYDLDLLIP